MELIYAVRHLINTDGITDQEAVGLAKTASQACRPSSHIRPTRSPIIPFYSTVAAICLRNRGPLLCRHIPLHLGFNQAF